VVVLEVDVAAKDLLELLRRDERRRVGLLEEADLRAVAKERVSTGRGESGEDTE